MKVLMLASYIFEPGCAEFEKNRTGFGMMVKDIIDFVGKKEEVIFSSRVITNGRSFENYKILKHTFSDIFKSARPRDYIRAISGFFYGKYAFKDRLRNAFYDFDGGYVRSTIKSERPDIVHIHGIGPITKSYIDICLKLKIPFVVTLHGLIGLDNSVLAPDSTKRLEKEFLIKALKENIPVTVISSGMKKRIEENYLLKPADNITVVLNGTKAAQGSKSEENDELTEKLRSLKLSGNKIIFAVGNITDNKNQIQLARIMKILKGENTFVAAVFFGNECDRGLLRNYIEKEKLTDCCIMAGFKEDIGRYYNLADLTVLLSLNDGFGLSIIEGYSFGVPSVFFSDLDSAEDVFNAECSLKCFDRSDTAAAETIKKALKTDFDIEKIKKFAESFTMESTADKYIEVYKNSI